MIPVYVLYCVKCKMEIVEAGKPEYLNCETSKEGMMNHIIRTHILPYYDENSSMNTINQIEFKVWWEHWCIFVEGRQKK